MASRCRHWADPGRRPPGHFPLYQFKLSALGSYLGLLPQAVFTTLAMAGVALLAATLAAAVLVQARRGGRGPLAWAALAYVEFFRNVPLLVLVYGAFFGLAQAGWRLSGFWAAVLALTLNATAYLTEIFRAGYAAIPPGQRQAALALGLRRWPLERLILLPQMLRVILPVYVNQVIGLVLGSSVAAVIGVGDLGDWMLTTGAHSFRYLEAFLVAALVYAGLCQLLAAAGAVAERRLARGGRG